MKTFVVGLIVFFTASIAYSAQSSIQGHFGMDRGALHLGADYEMRTKKTHGFGGFLLLWNSKEASETGKYTRGQTLAFGGFFKAYFGKKRWYSYLGPGVGGLMVDPAPNTTGESVTTFGPALKIGTLYRFNKKMALGMEYFLIVNAFDDTFSIPGASALSAAFRFTL